MCIYVIFWLFFDLYSFYYVNYLGIFGGYRFLMFENRFKVGWVWFYGES